ncbi:MAG: aspartate/glutamate racemase family protein [Bosea sp.]|uniref:aspartate/glutamate racemase family protein n=1 Tax=unclassified Bosea (in: a-proteobacteria) TaxID=2653178 RepID=UPI00095D6B88|nr:MULTISPECIES: aspartate/glutamate racemase family protein [unclassified Bosea (in: a-proteobacteria)]MBN9443072.1 aspartate/glutamate racemase family protein [Bosea sp. (in: a-proteobacteria)]MBN9456203.1 aspartate/glutamate racemase family protein [Bosea sp. (in: a-proteobacteria)]OJV05700.1 MAG: aspartate/glutamate racemase [Bosea sp. 67-29]
MATIGLIGGMSWESTAVYYRLLNEGVRARAGGLHSADVLLHSLDFAPIAEMQAEGDWAAAGVALADSARRLERAGAACLLLCTNTMHKVADQIIAATKLPFLHLADVTARAIRATPSRRPLLLATRFTMEQAFYRDRLKAFGVEALVPQPQERDEVHRIIYEELCRGRVEAASKERYLAVVERAIRDEGADGVILGCTEIGLLVSQADFAVPVFDTTALHAAAALDYVAEVKSVAA